MLLKIGTSCLAVLLLGVGHVSAQTLATVGGRTITVKEFKERYEAVKRQVYNPPSPETFLEDLIKLHMGVQEAEKKDLRKDPQVQRQIEEVLYKNLVEKAIGKQVEKITVNEEEMRKFYRDNPEIRLSHILIQFKPGATESETAEAEKRAKEIYGEVKKSKRPFEELVRLFTDDTLSKQAGGDIGYQSRVTIAPNVYDAVKNLKVGEITTPIRTRFGFQILKVTGRASYQDADPKKIRAAVFDQKRANLFIQYFNSLKKNYKIEIKKDLLKTLK